MSGRAILAVAATAVLVSGAAASGADVAPSVQVSLGPAVQARQHDLGADELASQALYLRQGVIRALGVRRAAVAEASLVIQDIEPNMPTSAQLGRSPGLNAASPGLGGAAVTGEVVTADGRRLPVRYRWFQLEPRNEVNFTTWGDADEAFDRLADALGNGRTPDDATTWPPPHAPRVVTGTLIP